MKNLRKELLKQVQTENYKDAEECILIYDNLKKLDDGHVWQTKWEVLVETQCIGGNEPPVYKATPIGKKFIRGIKSELEKEQRKHYINIRIALMSHLSDCVDMLGIAANEDISRKINFVKKLILNYTSLDTKVSIEELNELYAKDYETRYMERK